jgi:xylan 1,4-beta-xylosidase
MFDGQPYFDGFRDLATNGIDKPVLNAFRMLGMLGGNWIETTSSAAATLDDVLANGVREAPDINAVATRDEDGVSVLLWHYHDDDVPGPDGDISLRIDGLPDSVTRLRHYRMDATHSNAYAVWQRMGSPQVMAPVDYELLEKAGGLALIEEREIAPAGGNLTLAFSLPRQGVSLVRLGR